MAPKWTLVQEQFIFTNFHAKLWSKRANSVLTTSKIVICHLEVCMAYVMVSHPISFIFPPVKIYTIIYPTNFKNLILLPLQDVYTRNFLTFLTF